MIRQRSSLSLRLSCPALAAATLTLAASTASACPAGADGITTACGEVPDHVLRQRIDRTLASDPISERARARLMNTLPSPGAAAPFATTDSGDLGNLQTNLSQSGAAPTDRAFDVWVRPDSDFTERRRISTTSMGADYRLRSDLLIGALVQFDDTRKDMFAAPETVSGSAFLAGPYLAYRLTPNVLLDSKLAWGQAEDEALYVGQSETFAATRSVGQLRLTGSWNWNEWQISQSGALIRAGELSHSALPNVPGTKVDVTRVLVGPELRRQIDAGDGNRLEPFVFLKTSLDLESSSAEPPKAYNMIGGGLVLSRPSEYAIRATADYTSSLITEIDDLTSTKLEDKDVLTGKVQVNVPLQ